MTGVIIAPIAIVCALVLSGAAVPAVAGTGSPPEPGPGLPPQPPAALAGAVADEAAPGTSTDYLIGPGDLLDVTVFEEEALNRTVRVGPDGSISLPLLGEIPIAGLSKSQVEAEIGRRLGQHFLYNPQVSVFVKEYRSRRVVVMGAVREPGSYELLGPRTLLEVIAEAGGLAENAGRDLFVFGRAPDGSIARSRIDLDRLLSKGEGTLNLPIREGEIIQVPIDRPMAVYLYGAVAAPGLIEGRASEGMTLLQAVTRAGGPGPRAAVDRITILRSRTGDDAEGKRRMRVNLKRVLQGKEEDPSLEPDDIVIVPETFF